MNKEAWKVLPAVEAKDIHIGCACCSTACQIAHMDMPIAVGFGSAHVTKDDECVYQETHDGEIWTVRDAEDAALKYPDHDWQIMKMGPMHGETFQRQGPGRWVCVESNQGFA